MDQTDDRAVFSHDSEPPAVTLAVLNWNGVDLLGRYLPTLLEAARHWPAPTQVLVADNGSTDDSVAFVHERFPSIDVLELGANLGFSLGCNRAVAAARHEHVILLNSDVGVAPDFIAPLMRHLEQPDVFASTPRMLNGSGSRVVCSAITAEFTHGQLGQRWAVHDGRDLFDTPRPTLYATGAAIAFRRHHFEQLGGFSEVYSPFYWEDVDLSYRAWKRGWRVMYEPASCITHEVSASMEKGGVPKHRHLRRNTHLMQWSNWTDPGLLRRYLAGLPRDLRARIAEMVYHGTSWPRAAAFEMRALVGALLRLPAVLRLRRQERPHRQLRDAEVFELCDWTRDVPIEERSVLYR
jgi:GT2 family glycosyltransferase